MTKGLTFLVSTARPVPISGANQQDCIICDH